MVEVYKCFTVRGHALIPCFWSLWSKMAMKKISVYSKVFFPSSHLQMWELDHNSEHWRTDALELWCWRRLLSVPWTARKSNQSILKEINTEYSLERLMLKLKLQYFGHMMQRTDSLDKTLMLGKIEGKRRRKWQRMRWLHGITDSMNMSLSRLRSWWWTRSAGVLQSVGLQRVGHDWVTELNWTEATPS